MAWEAPARARQLSAATSSPHLDGALVYKSARRLHIRSSTRILADQSSDMSADLKWRPGDENNPYDPACMSECEIADAIRSYERGRHDPFMVQHVHDLVHDPVARKDYEEYLAAEMKDAAERRETMHERMRREKSEWAASDALSLKLKNKGNEALKAGDVKKAWFMYSLALEKSSHEPAYHLNRAAAAIQLGLYAYAEQDATQALKADGDQGLSYTTRFTPKAYFRRAQARRYMGALDDAEQDIVMALKMLPDDTALAKEQQVICELHRMTPDELREYQKQAAVRSSDEAFQEVIGYTIEEIDGVLVGMREQAKQEDMLNPE
ncbi:unnamed protein product [Peniophora sp. CBMAI 1063]|nr:unnamed protein product [Peniophora sp. CBMAI 1063]